jgi:hypothetical protein
VGAGTYAKVVCWLGDPHLVEKDPAHVVVIVLTGVEDYFRNGEGIICFLIPVMLKNGPADHGGLDELGASTYDC